MLVDKTRFTCSMGLVFNKIVYMQKITRIEILVVSLNSIFTTVILRVKKGSIEKNVSKKSSMKLSIVAFNLQKKKKKKRNTIN